VDSFALSLTHGVVQESRSESVLARRQAYTNGSISQLIERIEWYAALNGEHP
jgi:hypothetical protein